MVYNTAFCNTQRQASKPSLLPILQLVASRVSWISQLSSLFGSWNQNHPCLRLVSKGQERRKFSPISGYNEEGSLTFSKVMKSSEVPREFHT